MKYLFLFACMLSFVNIAEASVLRKYIPEVESVLHNYEVAFHKVVYENTYKDIEVKIRFNRGKAQPLMKRLHWSILKRARGKLWLDIMDMDTPFLVVGKGRLIYEIGLFYEYEDRYIIVGRQSGKAVPYGKGVMLLPCAEPLTSDRGLQKYFNCYILKKRSLPLAAVYVSKVSMSLKDVADYYKRQVLKVQDSTRPAFVGISGDGRAVYTKRRWGEGYRRTLVIYYRRHVFMIVSQPLVFKYRRLIADSVLIVDSHRRR
ncbi:MAG: hypothetical protein J7L41_07200 [Synergistetes bacterium]|nr:hypothetical protein [Synergistota bacterium]